MMKGNIFKDGRMPNRESFPLFLMQYGFLATDFIKRMQSVTCRAMRATTKQILARCR